MIRIFYYLTISFIHLLLLILSTVLFSFLSFFSLIKKMLTQYSYQNIWNSNWTTTSEPIAQKKRTIPKNFIFLSRRNILRSTAKRVWISCCFLSPSNFFSWASLTSGGRFFKKKDTQTRTHYIKKIQNFHNILPNRKIIMKLANGIENHIQALTW